MQQNIDLFKLTRAECVHCNFTTCVCPTAKESNKVISVIKENQIKGQKWSTDVYGDIDKDTFSTLKKILGTGGTYQKNHVSLRGKIHYRVKNVLLTLGYTVL